MTRILPPHWEQSMESGDFMEGAGLVHPALGHQKMEVGMAITLLRLETSIRTQRLTK